MSSHPIVHVEISSSDLEASGRFYSQLFGWKIEHTPELNYTTFQAEGGPGGGFNPISETNPAGTVVVYVDSDDIQADLAKAESLGAATVVPKTEIPQMGWFAMFRDPSGNTVGLYTAMNPAAA
jgi:predicted enzyme related to lactoylglutathione lyase